MPNCTAIETALNQTNVPISNWFVNWNFIFKLYFWSSEICVRFHPFFRSVFLRFLMENKLWSQHVYSFWPDILYDDVIFDVIIRHSAVQVPLQFYYEQCFFIYSPFSPCSSWTFCGLCLWILALKWHVNKHTIVKNDINWDSNKIVNHHAKLLTGRNKPTVLERLLFGIACVYCAELQR